MSDFFPQHLQYWNPENYYYLCQTDSLWVYEVMPSAPAPFPDVPLFVHSSLWQPSKVMSILPHTDGQGKHRPLVYAGHRQQDGISRRLLDIMPALSDPFSSESHIYRACAGLSLSWLVLKLMIYV